MKRPLPTASTMPSCGFSLAVSGSTMPLLVFSSRSTGLITTRSPSGRSFMEPSLGGDNTFSTQLARVLMIADQGVAFNLREGVLSASGEGGRLGNRSTTQEGGTYEEGLS